MNCGLQMTSPLNNKQQYCEMGVVLPSVVTMTRGRVELRVACFAGSFAPGPSKPQTEVYFVLERVLLPKRA
jgi:hypothetical protein